MDRWAETFDSWELCDQCCQNLFGDTPFALEKAVEWTQRPEEFVKRPAAFSSSRSAPSTTEARTTGPSPTCYRPSSPQPTTSAPTSGRAPPRRSDKSASEATDCGRACWPPSDRASTATAAGSAGSLATYRGSFDRGRREGASAARNVRATRRRRGISEAGSRAERSGIEVQCSLVAARQQGERLGLQDGHLVVVTSKPAHAIERVKPGEGDECDLAAAGTSPDLRASETRSLAWTASVSVPAHTPAADDLEEPL
jgi:hypothetical protein